MLSAFCFRPALQSSSSTDDEERVDVPAGQPCRIVFSATLQRSSRLAKAFVEEDQRTRARLQIWTDLPAYRGEEDSDAEQGDDEHDRPHTRWQDDEWKAYDFTCLCPPCSHDDSLDDSDDGADTAITFTAEIPFFAHPSTSGMDYSFTYRIRYSSGQIQWLGEYGKNGVVRVGGESTPGHASPSYLQPRGWVQVDHVDATPLSAGVTYERRRSDKEVGGEGEEGFIVPLREDEGYVVWGVGDHGISEISTSHPNTHAIQVLLLLPTQQNLAQGASHLRPPILALQPDTPAPLSLSSGSTNLILRDATRVTVHTFWHDQLPRRLEHFFEPIGAAIGVVQEESCVALVHRPTNAEGLRYPLSALVLPLIQDGREVEAPAGLLGQILDSPRFPEVLVRSVGKGKDPESCFFLRKDDDKTRQLDVSSRGTLLLVSPVLRLSGSTEDEQDEEWVVAVSSPHTLIAQDTEKERRSKNGIDALLPTPPPSPPLGSAQPSTLADVPAATSAPSSPTTPDSSASSSLSSSSQLPPSTAALTTSTSQDPDRTTKTRTRGRLFSLVAFVLSLYVRAFKLIWNRVIGRRLSRLLSLPPSRPRVRPFVLPAPSSPSEESSQSSSSVGSKAEVEGEAEEEESGEVVVESAESTTTSQSAAAATTTVTQSQVCGGIKREKICFTTPGGVVRLHIRTTGLCSSSEDALASLQVHVGAQKVEDLRLKYNHGAGVWDVLFDAVDDSVVCVSRA